MHDFEFSRSRMLTPSLHNHANPMVSRAGLSQVHDTFPSGLKGGTNESAS
jgi:hypothetical protein